jgi:murein DD-endopeptidase MepM/ murein hydrolase activator NlpD
MRLLLILSAFPIFAQSFHADPEKIIQGEVVRVTAGPEISHARMNNRTITLFPQSDGQHMGLMPVPVLTKPGPYALEFLDDKGASMNKISITVIDAHYHRENVSIAPSIAKLRPSPDEFDKLGEFKKLLTDARSWKEPFTPPVPGCITSPFGSLRMLNGKLTGSFHGGIDQRGAAGTPIHPIAAGTVKLVEKFNLSGGTVGIDHGQGVESVYLHMSAFNAKDGQQVTPSDTIGYVGSTGRSTGPHVHWTLYVYGQAMNPSQWMTLHPCTGPAPEPTQKHTDSKQ